MKRGEQTRAEIVNQALRRMRMAADIPAQLQIVELYRSQYGRRVAEQIERAAKVRGQ